MPHEKTHAFRATYGPWALVAGSSAGLGAQYATQLAAMGLNLVLVARRGPDLEALAARLREQYGVEMRTPALDLGQPDAADRLDQRTADLEIGLLVYNAARSVVGSFLDVALDDHLSELAVNTRTPLELVWRFGRRFRARGRGGVILMSSMSGAIGTPLVSNYAATKAYMLRLAEGLWDELRANGVDVIASTPAVISSATSDAQASGGRGAAGATTLTPEEVARATLAALGQGPTVAPSSALKLASFFMRRALPRASAIRMMGRAMREQDGG